MGKGVRRAKVVALLVALALVAVAVPLAEPGWWWVSTERIEVDHGNLRGYETRKRWGYQKQHGRSELYYKSTGFKALDEWRDNGRRVRGTGWTIDGKLEIQEQLLPGGFRQNWGWPPWLWGATDQSSPATRSG